MRTGAKRKYNYRFRLLADGTIWDRSMDRVAGYMLDQEELDEIWKWAPMARSKYLKEWLCRNNDAD